MARASMGLRMAMVCTVFSACWLAAGPAQADLGDPVVDALGDAAGGAQDTVEDTVKDTVDQVTGSTKEVVEDTVEKVTAPTGPSPQEPAPGGGATGPSQPAAEPPQDMPRVEVSVPQDAPAPPAADTSSHASSSAPAKSRKAHGDRPARERAPAVRKARRASAHGDPVLRPRVVARGAREVAAALTVPAGHPCGSGSLDVQDLRRCAREGLPLPGLGGSPMILLPAGLLMVGLGLVLVACGRRRDTSVVPAT